MAQRIELVRNSETKEAPLLVFVDSDEHPAALGGISCTSALARFVVDDWASWLTPWEAPALTRTEPDFAGRASETLVWLEDALDGDFCCASGLSPAAFGICGYSLAGLFSLWATLNTDRFVATGALSASLWYDGWVDFAQAHQVEGSGRKVYMSLGTKEKHGRLPRLKTVEEQANKTASILTDKGFDVRFELTPGGHFDHVDQRVARGIELTDAALRYYVESGRTDV